MSRQKFPRLPDRQKLPSANAANFAESNPVQRRTLAEALGISHQATTKLVKQGMPTHSVEAAKEWYAALQTKPSDYAGAKLQKTLREIERLDLIVARERGELINRAEVREAGVALGALLSAECSAIVNDLPGQIAGQDEVEIRPKLQSRIDLMLTNIRTKLNESAQ